MAIQNDGRIVVVGSSFAPTGGWNVTVARLDPNGMLESDFGNSGTASFDFSEDLAYAVTVQNDGKIVVGGLVRDYETGDSSGVQSAMMCIA